MADTECRSSHQKVAQACFKNATRPVTPGVESHYRKLIVSEIGACHKPDPCRIGIAKSHKRVERRVLVGHLDGLVTGTMSQPQV